MFDRSEVTIKAIKIGLLLSAVFLMRPMFLGQEYAPLATIIALVALMIHYIEYSKEKSVKITKKNFILVIASLIMWSYFAIHSVMVASDSTDILLKTIATVLPVVIIFAIILSSEKDNFLFFRTLIIVFVLLSLSFAITVLLGLVVGIDNLFMFEVPIATYNHPALFYFPFTSLSSFMVLQGFELPRFLGMFREPGILQAFLIWAFFNLKQYNLNKISVKLILVIGIFGTLSTSGIAIFFGTIAVSLFFNKKYFKGALLVATCILALLYAPVIGVEDKASTHGDSLDIRSTETFNGLEKLIKNPMGTGIYNKSVYDTQYSNINLLAASYTLGIIGLALALASYFLPLFNYPNKKRYLIGLAPLLITLLYAQPIFDTPLIYIMLLANYGAISVVEEKQANNLKSLIKLKGFKKYKLTW